MDVEGTLNRLQEFLQLLDDYTPGAGISRTEGAAKARLDRIKRELPLIKRLVDAVLPGRNRAMTILEMGSAEWVVTNVRDGVLAAIGALESRAEAERLLAPEGPRLVAGRLHDDVWRAAARPWDGGFRGHAIQNAATAVDEMTKAKVGRYDVSGDQLQRESWGLGDPTPGKPKLRLPGYEPGSQDYRSAHNGATGLGQGCMTGIRNLITHSTEEPDEQLALEYLAALSVLARWIDAAQVVTASD